MLHAGNGNLQPSSHAWACPPGQANPTRRVVWWEPRKRKVPQVIPVVPLEPGDQNSSNEEENRQRRVALRRAPERRCLVVPLEPG